MPCRTTQRAFCFFVVLTLAVALFAELALGDETEPEAVKPQASGTSGKKKSGNKKSSRKKKQQPKKYNEIIDVMADMGRAMCLSLAKLIKNPERGFNAHRRCDLFVECIEDMIHMSDAMVKEMDLTQQDMVDFGTKFPHYMTLRSNIKRVAKYALAKKKPSERQISDELHKDLTQWIMNVATQQTGHSSGIDKLPREQLKGLRNMGMKLPNYGGILDEDEMEEENMLLDEVDRQWAEQRGEDVDDDDLDSPTDDLNPDL